MPDRLVAADGDPAEVAAGRETIRLAFVAALQHLPPRQRAVLILCEVLRWKASEVAELLETSTASVNSALQRARATLEESNLDIAETPAKTDAANEELLARYVAAFEAYDMDALTALIHEDATQSMPPYDLWLTGRDDIFEWWFGPGIGCKGSKVIPTQAANGSPAFAQYKPAEDGNGYEPWAVQVLEVEDEKIKEFTFFLSTDTLFPLFGLPERLPGLVRQHVLEPHELDEAAELRRRVAQPHLARAATAASWSRASASTVTASAGTSLTSQNAIAGAVRAKSAHTRSQSPGRSARSIGPRTANAIVCRVKAIQVRPPKPR